MYTVQTTVSDTRSDDPSLPVTTFQFLWIGFHMRRLFWNKFWHCWVLARFNGLWFFLRLPLNQGACVGSSCGPLLPVAAPAGHMLPVSSNTAGETRSIMSSSFWRNFHHWLHRKLSLWQLSLRPVMKISSKLLYIFLRWDTHRYYWMSYVQFIVLYQYFISYIYQ